MKKLLLILIFILGVDPAFAYTFTYNRQIYHVPFVLTEANKVKCDQGTKEWQVKFGSDVKAKLDSYDDFDFEKMAEKFPCQQEVGTFSDELLSKSENFVDESKINYLIAFVNSLEYELEPEGDYWKTPYETLRDGSGDCEDVSFLLAYLISQAGFDALLVHYVDHMNVCTNPGPFVYTKGMQGISHGNQMYYMCEATSPHSQPCWKLGQYPQFVKDKGPPLGSSIVYSKKGNVFFNEPKRNQIFFNPPRSQP